MKQRQRVTISERYEMHLTQRFDFCIQLLHLLLTQGVEQALWEVMLDWITS